MKVKIGVSARHVHLSKEDFAYLFGPDHELTKLKDISQLGQYAAVEEVTLKTEKGQIDNVRILGPLRDYTQVEISKTDAYTLGLNPPIRTSGDVLGSSPITIVKDNKEIHKDYGCIIADRHIHMNPSDANAYGFKEKQILKVRLSGEKGGIIDNVYVKIKDSYVLEIHLDLDDANAHLVKNGDEGEIIINEWI